LNLHNFYLRKTKIGSLKLMAYFICMLVLRRYNHDASSPLYISFSLLTTGLLIWNLAELVQMIRLDRSEFYA